MAKTYNNPNPKRIAIIELLKNFNRDKNHGIWNKVIKELSRSRKNRRKVNLWKINKYSKENDIVIIPGKVLGSGKIDHKVTICGFEFSKKVKDLANKDENINLITINDLLKQNPRGSNVKILC